MDWREMLGLSFALNYPLICKLAHMGPIHIYY